MFFLSTAGDAVSLRFLAEQFGFSFFAGTGTGIELGQPFSVETNPTISSRAVSPLVYFPVAGVNVPGTFERELVCDGCVVLGDLLVLQADLHRLAGRARLVTNRHETVAGMM